MTPADESRVRMIPVGRIRIVNPRVRDMAMPSAEISKANSGGGSLRIDVMESSKLIR